MESRTGRSDIAFVESVWVAIAPTGGAVTASCRDSYRDKVLSYRGLGLDVATVATLITDQLDSNRRRFSSGLAAFNLLDEEYAYPAPAGTIPGDYAAPGRSFLIGIRFMP